MRSYLADFNKESGADAADLAAAMAGYENGRNRRFLNYTDSNYTFANRSKEKSDDLVDFILTQNVDYDALFEDAMSNVRDAEDVVDRALEIATARYAESQAKLDEMIDRLPSLEDGRKVARSDKDGQVYTLDGQLVDQDTAATIQFKGHEDSLEVIQQQEDTTDTDFEILGRVRQDEARMGEIREHLADKPDADRVRELSEEANEIKERNLQTIDVLNDVKADNSIQLNDFDVSVPSIPSMNN